MDRMDLKFDPTEHKEQSKTELLHDRDKGFALIQKVDSQDTPKEITIFHTTDRKKALKDNHIKGLVIVKILRKKLKCSYHTKDNSCVHIRYALESDERFARNAYIQDVENPILRNIIP